MRLTADEQARAREAAERLGQEADLPARTAGFEALRYGPETTGRVTLHLDDVSAIPFLDNILGVEFYQLRARVRAGDGDLFVATSDEVPGYERYNIGHLGLGRPRFVRAEPVGNPGRIAAACRHGSAFTALVEAAREAGALTVHPYMGSEPVWDLAADLASESGVPVSVLAPPPPVTWFANDKYWLDRSVRAVCDDGVLGGEPAVETRAASDPGLLADHLLELAGRHRRVALKMTRCASAMGNRVVPATTLRGLDRRALRALVDGFLSDKQWSPGERVLAVAWEDVDASPSTQLWIPPLGHGEPWVDGVYEQILKGPERVFWGSAPSRLGRDVDERLSRASLRVAKLYQHLGYVGRCSFDFVTVGDRACFVECNGRWGGTSSPMHLLDRLFPEGRPPYRACDFVSEALEGAAFPDLVARIGDRAWRADTGEGRFVLYNVGCLAPYGKLDVISIGRDDADAERGLEEELPALLAS